MVFYPFRLYITLPHNCDVALPLNDLNFNVLLLSLMAQIILSPVKNLTGLTGLNASVSQV